MSEDGDSFSKSVEEEEAAPKKISLFNYQNGKTLQDTLHAKADRVWDHSYFGNITLNGAPPTPSLHSQYS